MEKLTNRPEILLRNEVSIKFLTKLAFMGLDGSFSALEGRANCQKNIDACNAARRFRSRYSKPSLSPSEGKLVTQSIPNELLDVPFRAIVAPLGKGSFLKLSESLSRSITVRHAVNYIHNQGDPSHDFSYISQFKQQAIASISFHSQVLNRYGTSHIEYDVLDYVFEKDQSNEEIYNDLLSVLQPLGAQKIDITMPSGGYHHPIKNLTVDAMFLLGQWRRSSFEQILNEAKFFPRLLGLSSKPINVWDDEYPIYLKKLSIFCIGCISVKNNVTEQMAVLHRAGICHIADLVILSDKFYPLFFDQTKRKKLVSIAECRLSKRNPYKGVMLSKFPANSGASLWQLITIMGYSDGEFRSHDEKKIANISFQLIENQFRGGLDHETIEEIIDQTMIRMDQLYTMEQREVHLYEAASCITEQNLQLYALSVLHNVLMADGRIASEEMWVYNRLKYMWGIGEANILEDLTTIPTL